MISIELEKFEQLTFSGNFLEASNYLHKLLILLTGEGGKSISKLLESSEVPGDLISLLTRLCSSIGQTIVRPEFHLSVPNLETLMLY